jgi:hypothetical protein
MNAGEKFSPLTPEEIAAAPAITKPVRDDGEIVAPVPFDAPPLGVKFHGRRRIGRRGAAQNNCSGQFRRSPARRSQAKSASLRPRFLTVMGSLAGNIPPAAAQAHFIASNGGW